ncbi:hypothetical protein ONZ45_g14857 [Pleurotus djamor]|nr:hypothetical protein ONZ45_g14857 [Pleurotus djamor]
MGVGAGLIYAPSIVIQGHHWNKRKSFAMAMIALGNSIGGAIFPIMLNRLFHGSAGFAQGVRASAYLCLGLLALSNLLMKDNPAFKQNAQKASGRGILTDFPFWVFTFGLLCLTCALFFPFFYLELFATNNGIQPQVAFYLLAIFNAAGIVGRVAAGVFAHRFGPFNVIIVSLFCATGLIFGLLGVKTATSSIVFAVLYGMISGIVLSLPGACTAVLSSRVPDQIGLRFGIACFITAFGALGTGPINGALLGPNFIWWKPIAFSGVMSALGLVCLVLVLWHLYTSKEQEPE